MSKLKNKIAVISGGTTGIGLATAQRFVAEGAHVFIFGRRQALLDEAAKRNERNVTAIQADAANLDDLDRVAAAVRGEKGVVDIIVSNAGHRGAGFGCVDIRVDPADIGIATRCPRHAPGALLRSPAAPLCRSSLEQMVCKWCAPLPLARR